MTQEMHSTKTSMFTNVGLVLNIYLYIYVMHLADGAMCENCAKQQIATSCKVSLIDNNVEFY